MILNSGCAPVYDRQFLGYRLLSDGRLVIAPHSVKRIEDKVRKITKRNRGVSLEQVIYELNLTLRGWINYFRFTAWNSQVAELDQWIRRKLRCYRIKQRKQGRSLYTFLSKLGHLATPVVDANVVADSAIDAKTPFAQRAVELINVEDDEIYYAAHPPAKGLITLSWFNKQYVDEYRTCVVTNARQKGEFDHFHSVVSGVPVLIKPHGSFMPRKTALFFTEQSSSAVDPSDYQLIVHPGLKR